MMIIQIALFTVCQEFFGKCAEIIVLVLTNLTAENWSRFYVSFGMILNRIKILRISRYPHAAQQIIRMHGEVGVAIFRISVKRSL